MKRGLAVVVGLFVLGVGGLTSAAAQVKPLPIPGSPPGQVQPLPIPDPATKKIMAEGVATVFNGNVQSARQAALRMAYGEAVGRGSGVEIGSMSLIKNVKWVTSIVAAKSRGFIKSYKVIREGLAKDEPTKYEVVIEAEVVEGGKIVGTDQFKALETYLGVLGNPRLLIILPERRVAAAPGTGATSATGNTDKTNVEFAQGDTKLKIVQEKTSTNLQSDPSKSAAAQNVDAGDSARSTEAALAQAFAHYGYQVVTSDDLLAQGLCTSQTLANARAGVTADAVTAARAAGADLAFLGVLRLSESQIHPQGVDLVMVTAEASAKALVVSSGKMVDAFHRAEQASSRQMLKAYADCLDKIADGIASTLAWDIPRILSDEYRETRLEVNGLDLRQAMDLKAALMTIEGVEDAALDQIPSERNPVTRVTIKSGFVFVEPLEIMEKCARALKVRFRLINANKFEVQLAVTR